MKKIAILKGDGIGPEIMDEAIKVLMTFGCFEFEEAFIGGAAFDKCSDHFPKKTKEICKNSDAILFGSVGGPISEQDYGKWKNCERNSILGIRKYFNFNVNLRPVKVYRGIDCVLREDIVDKGVDIMCVRELSSGIYFGEHKTEGKIASDLMIYDEETIFNIADYAFKVAMKRRKKVTSVDKANVLDCSKLWRKIVDKVALSYPDCELEHILVDNMAMQVIKRPFDFDVLLMPNMFGDIISDLISVVAGSLGMLPSASINNEGFAMYEPSGGSAPDIAGKGIANPIGQILSAAMMLKYSFDMNSEHDAILSAIDTTLNSGIRTADIGGTTTTSEMGDEIIKNLNQ